jgi:hypothetical protein
VLARPQQCKVQPERAREISGSKNKKSISLRTEKLIYLT